MLTMHKAQYNAYQIITKNRAYSWFLLISSFSKLLPIQQSNNYVRQMAASNSKHPPHLWLVESVCNFHLLLSSRSAFPVVKENQRTQLFFY